MAIHNYHDVRKKLPPARYSDVGFNGAFLLILPYVEQETTFQHFDFNESYLGTPENKAVANTPISTYVCPSMLTPREIPEPDPNCFESGAVGSYAVSTGSDICFVSPLVPKHDGAIIYPRFGTTTLPKISNADGTTKTLMVGELNFGLTDYIWDNGCKPSDVIRGGNTRWAVGYPGVTWASAAGPLNSTKQIHQLYGPFFTEYEAFRSDHPGGVNFLMVDGSCRFIADDIEHRMLKALATRDGGEKYLKGDF